MSEPVLSIRVHVPLQRFALDVDFTTSARRVGVFGPSGAGKTTLLEAVAGWRSAARGRVSLGGRVLFDTALDVSEPLERRNIGYVPQEALLFPHWDVRSNVRAGLARARGTDAQREAWVARVVKVLELESLLPRSATALSGGEQRRVALARALCSNPDLLLLDEPLGALDLALRRRILPYLLRIAEEFGIPMMYVSHDAAEVSALCDEVLLLRDGRIAARGEPAEILIDSFSRSVMHGPLESVLRGEVSALGTDTARITLAGGVELAAPGTGLAIGDRVVLSIRADEILIALGRPERISARNVLAARVERMVDTRPSILVRTQLLPRGPSLDVQLTHSAVEELELAPGRDVYLVIKSHACRVLSSLAQ